MAEVEVNPVAEEDVVMTPETPEAPVEAAATNDDDSVTAVKGAGGATPKKKKKLTGPCGNCRTEGAKLRCTKCKKTVYCNRTCQKSDWRFHKRICKDPEQKKKEAAKKKADEAKQKKKAKEGESKSGSKSTTKGKRTKSSTDSAALDAEDEELVKSLGGYHYFHKDVAKHEAKAPELVDGEDDGPMLMTPAAANSTPPTSAWNANAKTWEERSMTAWAKNRLEELVVGVKHDVLDGELEVKSLEGVEGEASIAVVRGKPRYLYDFTFKAKCEFRRAGNSAVKKAEIEFVEFSQDEEQCELRVAFKSPKPDAMCQAAIRSSLAAGSGPLFQALHKPLATFAAEYRSK